MERIERPPVFSALGHTATRWSTMVGNIGESRGVRWGGAAVSAHLFDNVAGEASVQTRSLELHFSWNNGIVEADATSRGIARSYRNQPQYALILPPDTPVDFRVRRKENYRLLTVQLQPEFLRSASEHDASWTPDILEVWNYHDPLVWELARAILEECDSGAKRGLLYLETAVTMLSLHIFRQFSASRSFLRLRSRGGLRAVPLRTVCEYMVSHLHRDISLREVAATIGLSPGHFALAFKRSTGRGPNAWLRQQRIERAKQIMARDPLLPLTSVALMVGYANLSALGVAFKRETGVPPSFWRANVGR